jgi:branched-chain amino acid aminotransferase
VVILNIAGELTEASVSNIAFAKAGVFVTPPLSAGILGGITRALILGGIAASAGIVTAEETIRPVDFSSMEECFLLSTTKDVVPVGAIDQVAFKVSSDTLASRLKGAFAKFARDYAGAHPELVA